MKTPAVANLDNTVVVCLPDSLTLQSSALLPEPKCQVVSLDGSLLIFSRLQ